ncbi:MAG: HEAT repeat domain-containing protein [Verrucomicrobiales bacterium]|nr:HEAT repeat domain-containing protein [Verrucomicrobiales bacterium]
MTSPPILLRQPVFTLIALLAAIGTFSLPGAEDPAAGLSALQLAPGLRATLWASEPLVENPVAISFDDRGRCYIAETHRWSQSVFDITKQPSWLEADLSFRTVTDRSNFLAKTYATNFNFLTKDAERVRFVEDRQGTGRAGSGGILADGFNAPTGGTAAGVLAWGDDVWFANIPDLWRLRSQSASGQADIREVVSTGFGVHIGVSGHDLHGLKMGPDGRLYFSIGDRGFNLIPPPPTNADTNSGWHFSFAQPDTGAVLRCEPDGSQLEVFAIGLRNPQELTFDAEGNLWTGDNDTAGADESRLLNVVEGGDYGWRCSYQHQAGFGPWVQEEVWRGLLDDTLPTSGQVAQGPSGVEFYPGTGFGDSWKNHFFMCDFPGGIWDFTVSPKGASYTVATKRKFLWNTWPTDMEFGPDGAAYVADWVFGWEKPSKGRIYRLIDTNSPASTVSAEVKELLRVGFKDRPTVDLGKLISHPDQRVRLRAQFALAARPNEGTTELSRIAQGGSETIPRLHAIWGLGQIARRHRQPGNDPGTAAVHARIGDLLISLLAAADPEVRAQAAKQLGELRFAPAAEALLARLSDSAPRVRLFAGISVGRLGRRAEIGPVLEMLRQNAGADRFLVHSGLMALLGLADTATLTKLQRDTSPAVRQAAVLALRRRASPEIAAYLNDYDPTISYLAARAINDVPIEEALPELATYLGKIDSPTQLLSRAINANFRVGDARNATVLANFANRVDAPEDQRVQALEALADWSPASPIDRVVGLWRPLPNRSTEPAKRAIRAVAASIHGGKSERVKIAAMKAIAKLGVKEAGHGLFESLQGDKFSPSVRAEVLRTLAAMGHSRWPDASQIGLTNSSPMVRVEALRLVAERPNDSVVDLLPSFLSETNDLPIRQTALRVLGHLTDPKASLILNDWFARSQSGQIPSELLLDLLEAAKSSTDPQVQAALARYRPIPNLAPTAWTKDQIRPLLSGGDATAGKKVFLERVDLACQRCHQVGGAGGTVGPTLDGIGKKLSREELLKAILQPNDRIATGFEQADLTLSDGTQVSGTVREETVQDLVVENLEEGRHRVSKTRITERRKGLSAMPEGLEKLMTQRELRDLVEFLASLK